MWRAIVAVTSVWMIANAPAALADASDLSTPKKAAIAFVHAQETADFDAIKGVSVGTDDDYNNVKSVLALIEARRKLRDAAVQAFGPEGKQLADDRSQVDFSIEDWQEKIEGDHATLARPGEDPWRLHKVGDAWKLDLSSLPHHQKMTDALQKVIAQTTAEVSAGKYKTLDEAKLQVTNKIFAVVKEQMSQVAHEKSKP